MPRWCLFIILDIYPESDWNVASLKYSYDQNKWLQNVTAVLKDGTEVLIRSYTYDIYGSVAEIKDYRALSNTGEKVNDPAYIVCTYTYDAYRRPASMSYADSTDLNTVKEAYTYTYDKNSRLVRETIQNLYPEEVSDRQNEVRSYTYDVRGNLVRTEVEDLLNTEESYVTAYTYDAVGNRLTQTKTTSGQTETTQYTYNSLNQMLTSTTTKADGTVTETKTYQYDANGNQIKESDSVSNTETLNTYDPAGRLVSCIKKENSEVTLEQTNKYNGSGARIQKKESVTEEGVSTETVNNYFYSQGGVLYTEDGSGNGTSLNLQGISGNVIATAREEAGVESYYYYHKDPTGSTTNLRSADGTTVVSYQYTDFGETSIYGDTDFYNEICYNGAIYDESTGLYYLSARYYDPEDGRFLTRDSYRGTATNAMTWHLYAYCANNPINYDDPSGHIAISRIIGGVIGAAAGAFVGSKIAKKTNATGWKKVAIVAGCTLAGGVVGAIAGPKVAKVAKKAASAVNKVLTNKSATYQNLKTTLSNVKSSANKIVTKTKQAITSMKSHSPVTGKGGYNGNIKSGEGFGTLAKKEINVTQKGIDKVRDHIVKHGFDAPENDIMIRRLEDALKTGRKINGADASFYMHGLKESTLMEQGMGYDVAHGLALKAYQVSPFSVYHPEAILANPSAWGKAWFSFWGL